MADPDNKKQVKVWLVVAPILILQLGLFGFLYGFLSNHSNRLSGFFWGVGAGVTLCIVTVFTFFVWKWVKKGVNKGKLLPYMIGGVAAAIAISGLLAINLGKPSCEEQGDAPYSSCTAYSNDGFDATAAQHWHKFWLTLPVATIIFLLIAYIVHEQVEKSRQKL
jgi:hypothetical protein